MDRPLLLVTRGARAFGFGFSAVLIGLHLERNGLSAGAIGLTLGVGLAAASLSGLGSAAVAARFGRRRTLAIAGALMTLTGLDLALSHQPVLLVLAGITGMLGAASVDLGPFASVEQAVLAEATNADERNVAFARYSLSGGVFNAAGSLAAALSPSGDARPFFYLYAALGVITALLPLAMSARVEAEARAVPFGNIKPLLGLSALFTLDALGGGFIGNAVIAYWLHVRFGTNPNLLGPVFAVVAALQAVSYEVSGRLGNRIGLVNTMVFTHLPSNVLLLLVPFCTTFPLAVVVLWLRFALSQMDVPARQAYVVSIVPSAERAGAVAVTGAVRGVGQAVGAAFAGLAIGSAALGLPFFAGGGLKIVYDGLLYAGYRNRRASHER